MKRAQYDSEKEYDSEKDCCAYWIPFNSFSLHGYQHSPYPIVDTLPRPHPVDGIRPDEKNGLNAVVWSNIVWTYNLEFSPPALRSP